MVDYLCTRYKHTVLLDIIPKSSHPIQMQLRERIAAGNLLQVAASSSLPSLQSGSPSHFHEFSIHRPLDLHLNSSSGQGRSQFISSDRSPQSLTPSQMVADGVQFPLAHWYAPPRQCLAGHVAGSSDPSSQSFSPSHLYVIERKLVTYSSTSTTRCQALQTCIQRKPTSRTTVCISRRDLHIDADQPCSWRYRFCCFAGPGRTGWDRRTRTPPAPSCLGSRPD